MSEKVEFIESYIKVQGGDYQWNDNHGELIRCKDCKHKGQIIHKEDGTNIIVCWNQGYGIYHPIDWFCADGERSEEK